MAVIVGDLGKAKARAIERARATSTNQYVFEITDRQWAITHTWRAVVMGSPLWTYRYYVARPVGKEVFISELDLRKARRWMWPELAKKYAKILLRRKK